ncbi:prenyltransferase [Haloarcula sp. S1CR25-12]|uniref:Prenyltransferase n=1 Tax=Haloarcula saliterrae TaxID=2950534 RepID=A0ABU2FCY4_9EURY|nr:prenyltransferase [Haloarcula sp. S1CR25-12]MDS0260113.1 prenyltransferase [Haloarcula sp. S1CR25-12]
MRIVPTAESRLGYLFRLSRPRYWHFLGSPVLLALIYGASSASDLTSPAAIAFAVYFLVPGNLFLYGVNDAFDTDTDEHNPKKSEEGKEQSFRDTPGVKAAIVLSGLLAVPLFFLTTSPVALLALGGWAFLTVTYSAPPLRLKSIPFVDSVVNGLYLLPGIAAYITIAGSFPPMSGVVGFWLWTMGYHTFSAIPDIGPDRKAGVRTLASVLGKRKSLVYTGVCWLLAAVVFAQLHLAAALVFLLYPVIDLFIMVEDIDVERAYWWFPTINAVVGIPLMVPGLWLLLS